MSTKRASALLALIGALVLAAPVALAGEPTPTSVVVHPRPTLRALVQAKQALRADLQSAADQARLQAEVRAQFAALSANTNELAEAPALEPLKRPLDTLELSLPGITIEITQLEERRSLAEREPAPERPTSGNRS